MQEDKREFTLRQMLEIIKKSWLTIVIFVLIAAIVFGTVMVVAKTYTTVNTYNATVSFTSSSSTVKPWTTKGVVDYLKSSENINKALSASGYSQDEINQIGNEVQKNIVINAIIPSVDKDSETEFVPTTFSITMSEINGVSQVKNNEILSNIVIGFTEFYNAKYGKATQAGSAVSDYTIYDYTRANNEISQQLDSLIKNVNDLETKINDVSFTSGGMTVSQLKSALETLQRDVMVFDEYITINGITKGSSDITVFEYIDMLIQKSTNSYTMLSSQVQSYKEIIEIVNSNGSYQGTVEGQTIIIEDQTSYYNFLNKYNELVKEAEEMNAEITYWTQKKTTFENATAFNNASEQEKATIIANANTKLTTLQNSLKQMVEVYNSMVFDYNEFYIGSDGAYIVMPAHVISTAMISNTILLLSLFAVVVIAAGLGFLQGRKKYLAFLDKQEGIATTAEKQ